MRRTPPSAPAGSPVRAAPLAWLPLTWLLLAALVLAQIGYPLTGGGTRTTLTIVTVVLGFLLVVSHAALTRGPAAAAILLTITAGGGLGIEALGVRTGFPFGSYEYSGHLGPELLDVPLVIPLAWTWMAWPAWLAAARVVSHPAARIALGGAGLGAWDLFLDPQMVTEGHWRWLDPGPALPGVPGIPVSNYLGWLAVAVLMMALLSWLGGDRIRRVDPADASMYALYLWTYASSILAHLAFLDLPASAGWGAVGMAVLALPLAWRLAKVSARPGHARPNDAGSDDLGANDLGADGPGRADP